MHLGSLLSLSFLLLLWSLLSLLLSHLNLPKLNLSIQIGEISKKGRTWLRLEDLVRPMKTRLNKLWSSKRLATQHNGAWRDRKLNLLSHEPGSQHPCITGSPWEMMHRSGTSTGALGATLPWPWRRPCCFHKTWPSYEARGRMKSSFTVKDIWGWYNVNPLFFTHTYYL